MTVVRLSANIKTAPALLIVASAMLSGCVRQYEAPLPSQPHAVVKIRRAYASHAGTRLSESAFIDKYQVMTQSRAADLDETQTSAVRVHPGPIAWEIASAYTHVEPRQVQEHYTVQEPYTTSESYNCGSGTSSRSCTRMVTRYRSQSKYRWVTKQVTVTDAQCSSKIRQLAEIGHMYLLQYSYTASGICSLVCVEQVPRSDGQFDTKPCSVPPKPSDS